jgi:hypothetical protein
MFTRTRIRTAIRTAGFLGVSGACGAFGLWACTAQNAVAILAADGSVDAFQARDAAGVPAPDVPLASERDATNLPGPDVSPAPGLDATDLPAPDAPPAPGLDAPNLPAPDVSPAPVLDAASLPALDGPPAPVLDAARAGLPFRDGFDNGIAYNWLLSASGDGPVSDGLDGTNRIATLDATNNDFTRIRTNLDGSKFIETDVLASVRFRLEQAPTATRAVRLDVRQAPNTENIFYAVGASIDSDGKITKVSIFKKVFDGVDNYTICSLKDWKPDAPIDARAWRTLTLRVRGTKAVDLTAALDGNASFSALDDCTSDLTATNGETVPNGGCLTTQTGLGLQIERGIVASFDDVLVTAP